MKKKKIINKLKHKEKLGTIQSDFVTLTSHQLRTPLSGTKWLLELLQKGTAGKLTKKQQEYVEKIYASNERMIALVNDLLEVTRVEIGENKLYLQPTDLTSIIRSLLREKQVQIEMKHLQVTFIVEHEPFPLAKTEKNKIKQALGNIISNALFYTREKGKITIELKTQDGMIMGLVEDDGIGIPLEQHKLVFGKFFRGSNILQFETTGTGLGLYITKAFIEASGGKIWFKSKVGQGTTFYFTLPLA